jgi:cation diffusion facilitator CzcD-associated flavoprotein CzcO
VKTPIVKMGSVAEPAHYDAIVVGGGFGGIFTVYNLRKFNFNCHLFERGNGLGGAWHWNCYPGARVDSNVPIYQFTPEDAWDQWDWSERYPGQKELKSYFNHLDKVWEISKDTTYNAEVRKASWDATLNQWNVEFTSTIDNQTTNTATARFLIYCTGLNAQAWMPDFKDLNVFKGFTCHTSFWPQQGLDLKGKRVGIIGTGASGVQTIQEIGPEVEHLTVFQRTPNTALPMDQVHYDKNFNDKMKEEVSDLFIRTRETWSGFLYTWRDVLTKSVSPEEREQFYEEQWKKGGFEFWVGNFKDVAIDQEANDHAYAFWRKKVHERVKDPKTAELLAPKTQIHPLGTRRPCLETTFYEVFNLPNVDLVDVRSNAIQKITPNGVKLSDGSEYEFDVLILATGFDSNTGCITNIDHRGIDKKTNIKARWAEGVWTNLGMASHGYPNCFYIYGPQSPAAFVNAPTLVEVQVEWLIDVVRHMRRKGLTTIEATEEQEKKWREENLAVGNGTLFPKADGWYYGSNIPGKAREPLNYMAGLPIYKDRLAFASPAQGYGGFTVK